MDSQESILSYYAQPGPFTNLKEYSALVEELPAGIPELVETLQNLVVHIFWAGRYGLELSEERKAEVQIRSVSHKLAQIQKLSPGTLLEARPLEKRLVSNCRDFSTLLCAMLRARQVPARARCGFGTYFMPDHFEDHWMCEYWRADERRWVKVDSQLDAFQREVLGINFDPLDMPEGAFVLGGEAWQMCRSGEADPDTFGIFELHGMDFVRGNLFRDLLSLNKIELLPWDCWGLLEKPVAECNSEEMALFDQAAELTLQGNDSFPQLRSFYEENSGFHAPFEWLDERATA